MSTAKERLDEHGREKLDPKPVAMPLGFERPETLAEQIQRMVRQTVSQEAADQGFETFEDADDFDVGDDFDPTSPYEMEFDPILGREVSPQMVAEGGEHLQKEYISKAVDHPELQQEIDADKRRFKPRWPWKKEKEAEAAPAPEVTPAQDDSTHT